MLVLDKLTKKFDDETILDSLSFTFDDTGLYFLKGENGSGKSTLLSILAGKDESYAGKLFYNECLINNKNKNDYADNHVTYVPQNSFVLEDETVLDNVLLPYNRKDKERAIKILTFLGLEDSIDQNASSLSAGEKQRLSFARADYGRKDILLLDEVTSNLDKESADIILQRVSELSKDHLVIFVTHEKRETNTISNSETISLSKGKLIGIDKSKGNEKRNHSNKQSVLRKDSLFLRLKSSFLLDKFSHVFLIAFTAVFSFLFLFFDSLGGSWKLSYDSSFHRTKTALTTTIQKSLVDSTDIILGDDKSGYEGVKNRIRMGRDQWRNLTKGTFPKNNYDYTYPFGKYLSGVCDYPKEDSFIKLVSGTKPKNPYDILISDYCSRIQKIDVGDQIQITDQADGYFRVSGIYQSKDSKEFETRFSEYKNNSRNFFSPSVIFRYSYRIETAFAVFPEGFQTDKTYGFEERNLIFPKTAKNRSIYLSSVDTTLIYSNGSYVPFLVGKDGKPVIGNKIDQYLGWLWFGMASFGALLLFYLVFLYGRYIRNRRKYLLLRYRGTRRDSLTKDRLLSNSVSVLLGTLIGIVSVGFTVLGINLYYDSVLLTPIHIMHFDFFSLLLLLALSLFFLLFLSVLLWKVLAKKDLTKQLNEAKEK